jgi:L-ascorbate metabolism protein UlaG (beta-lactamase superfamily)
MMRIRWYGQSAFSISGGHRVFIDPFGEMEAAKARGIRWDYPAIDGAEAETLLVTHEHGDHNAVDVVGGEPFLIRSSAGSHESPLGTVTGVASEHDRVAGTERGANVVYLFELDDLRICHLGDFGQAGLRPEQQAAIGRVDVLFLPVGGGPTVGGEDSAAVARALEARLVVPMHYRTPSIGFLEEPDTFLEALGAQIVSPGSSEFDVEPVLASGGSPLVVLPDAPIA